MIDIIIISLSSIYLTSRASYVYTYVGNKILYKYKKKYAYKKIEESLKHKSFEKFKKSILLLKQVDREFGTIKYEKYLEKLGMNDIIINNEELFKLSIDPSKKINLFNKFNDSNSSFEKIEKKIYEIEHSISELRELDL